MESENDVAAECYYNSGGSNYCCACDAYDVNPVVYEGKPYCRRCATKYVPDDPPEEEHGTESRIAEGWETKCSVCGENDTFPFLYYGKAYCHSCYEEHFRGGKIEMANVPFPLQEHLLKTTFYDTAQWLLHNLNCNDAFVEEIEEIANERLVDGYERYGSKMYEWDEKTRRENILEELADIFVYASSGRFEE